MEKKKKIIIISVVIIAILLAIITTIILVHDKKNIINIEVEEMSEKEYQYFILKSEEKYGVIDINGKKIIEPKYDNIVIPNPKNAIFICSLENEEKNIILNEKEEQLFNIYDNVEAIQINGIMTSLPFEKKVLKYKVNDKYGLIDFEGKRITKAIYDEIDGLKYKEGQLIARLDEKYGVININGEKVIDFEYDWIEGDKYFEEDNGYSKSGYIISKKTEEGYRYGYISIQSKKILDIAYNNLKRIMNIKSDDIYFIASVNGQYGLIKNDEVIMDFKYQSIEYNELNNILIVGKGVNYGIYSILGEEIIPFNYKMIQINGVYIYAKDSEKIDYFDIKGNKVENGLTSLNPVDNGKYYISINEDGLYGIVDSNMKKVCENKYIYIEYLFDEYFSAYKNEKGLGIIDANGKVVIDFKYTILNKIGNSRLIKAEDMKKDLVQIYSENLQLVKELENSDLDVKDKYIKLYNENSEIYLDMQGETIDKNKAEQLTEEAPDVIGEYTKTYYGYSQVQYTDEK